jgi:hypothetical protein
MKAEYGKPRDDGDHRSLAVWAADCAERVLSYFEGKHPKDDRPRKAIEAARAWTRGEIRVGPARVAAVSMTLPPAPPPEPRVKPSPPPTWPLTLPMPPPTL